jgi:putative nucleotidyltransferase with HDIG domain
VHPDVTEATEVSLTVDPSSASFADLNDEESEIVVDDVATSDNQIAQPDKPRPPLVKAAVEIDQLVEMELPPLPGSALRVALLSMDMNVSTTAVAEAIGCDPVLTTRILRAANSPLYAVERKFTNLTSAVNALGNLAINQLVVIYAVSDAFHQNSKNSRLERPLWRHSVAVAVGAREICNALNLRSGEEAFLCGLLHDIGKLLLMRHDAQIYEQVEKYAEEHERVEVEQEIYKFTHAEIGALVANRWGLADEVSKAIFDHHHPIKDQQMPVMTLIIDAADKMANAAGAGLRIDGNPEMSSIQSLAALGFTEQQIADLWEQTETRLDEMMHVLSSLI